MTKHLRMPLALGPTGRLATVQADGVEDVAQSLALLASTRVGERLSVPGYGTPQLLFGQEPPVEVLRAAAGAWEPRAAPYRITLTGRPEDPTVTIAGETK